MSHRCMTYQLKVIARAPLTNYRRLVAVLQYVCEVKPDLPHHKNVSVLTIDTVTVAP